MIPGGVPGGRWAPPQAWRALDASVDVPGSKSLTARYLVAAALADGPSLIRGALRARDTDLMAAALSALGSRIEPQDTPPPQPEPPRGAGQPPPAARGVDLLVEPGPLRGGAVDVGLAGTVMRFLAPVAALADGTTRFTGDPAAARRPIGPLLDALERLGVATRRPVGASLPFEVSGRGRVAGGPVTLDASASSQFLSALLLAAPRFAAGARVVLEPRRLPSRPHVAMTLEALAAFGARSTAHGDYAWEVAPGGLAGREITVEPDLTSAAPFLAAALVAPGTVRLRGWPRRTTQAGALMLDYLTAFGGQTAWRDGALAATGTGPISPVRLDLRDAGELTPVVAALATLADGPSRLDGIAHLRGHETDRLAALEREINRLGARAEQTADGITITPAPLRGALVRTYGDHRMAMFGAVVALKTPGVVVEDLGATAKTFPGFAAAWEAML